MTFISQPHVKTIDSMLISSPMDDREGWRERERERERERKRVLFSWETIYDL